MPTTKEMTEIEQAMSNFYHTIDAGAAEALIADRNSFCRYAGCNFNGKVYATDNGFACEVWRYGRVAETIESESLSAIMTDVSEKYGWE